LQYSPQCLLVAIGVVRLSVPLRVPWSSIMRLRCANSVYHGTFEQGDPASAYHPVHPPFKAELSRRANLIIQNLVFANKSSPTQVGPQGMSVACCWALRGVSLCALGGRVLVRAVRGCHALFHGPIGAAAVPFSPILPTNPPMQRIVGAGFSTSPPRPSPPPPHTSLSCFARCWP
jgi:hypothetical protein